MGGGGSGDVPLAVDTAVVQRRVSSSCPSEQSIRIIDPSGTVTCQPAGDGVE